MNNQISDGKYLASQLLKTLENKISTINSNHFKQPTLAIVLVGNNSASEIYVRNKINAANKIGMHTLPIYLPSTISNELLLSNIDTLNNDMTISGIIVQLPLPAHINKELVLSHIMPSKDVDGFHPLNVGYLHTGLSHGFVPCTALGCLHLIKNKIPNLSRLSATIINRSNIVGKPLAALLMNEDVTVTICHSKTKNLIEYTKNADIVVTAVGKPNLFTEEYFNINAVVIDVGINRIQINNKVVGDVNYDAVYPHVKYVSPVPGGIGPLTVAFLLQNTFNAFLKQNNYNQFS